MDREGEITDADKISLLREFTARQSAVGEHAPSWSWEPGVALFPEAVCPYCRGAMRSNRIWLIADRQVLGQWELRGRLRGRLVKEQRPHPHVNGTNICMGGAQSELTALFFSMNPADSYWGTSSHMWQTWLRTTFDHECVSAEVECRHECCPDCCRANGCTGRRR